MAVAVTVAGDGAGKMATPSSVAHTGSNMKRDPSRAVLLRDVPHADRLRVDFDAVSAWVPTLSLSAEAKQPKERQILWGITGVVEPGEVLGE